MFLPARQGRNSKEMMFSRTESPSLTTETNAAEEDKRTEPNSFLTMLDLDENNTENSEERNLSDLLDEINKKLEMVSGSEGEDTGRTPSKDYDVDYAYDFGKIRKKPLINLETNNDALNDIEDQLANDLFESIITERKDRVPKEASDISFDIEHDFNIEDDPVKESSRSTNQINDQKPSIPLADSPVLQIRQQPQPNSVSQAAGQFLQQQSFSPQQQQSFNNQQQQYRNQQQFNNQNGIGQQQQQRQFNNNQQYYNTPQQEFNNPNQFQGGNYLQQPQFQQQQQQPNQFARQGSPYPQAPTSYPVSQSQATPRQFDTQEQQPRTGLLNEFGDSMGPDASTDPEANNYIAGPQLLPRQQAAVASEESGSGEEQLIVKGEEDEDEEILIVKEEEEEDAPEEVRCINKVMQVEETVYENRIKCQHTFTEKCHDTFITDYVPTQERKCETSFDKSCHITYKPMMFEETVQICNEPLKKVCNNETVGEEICKTHYETTCETRYKEHEVEQDEPVCKMVTERKCNDVRVPVPGSTGFLRRRRRQADVTLSEDLGLGPNNAFPQLDENDLQSLGLEGDTDLLSVGQECEDWQVQKCTLEKKVVKKTNPETSCQKMPREICAPSNCAFKKSEKVCRDETKSLIQNIPTEDCDLEPQESCKMETVLVPRLIQQPNCIKVPKEICVNAKSNPKKVKKPVIKEWCYKPSDLKSPSTRLALSQFFSN